MHDYKVKVPNFMFCEHMKTTFFFSLTSIQSFRIKPLKYSPIVDKLEVME